MPGDPISAEHRATVTAPHARQALESLARAARQVGLYGPEHPIAAQAVRDACHAVTAGGSGELLVQEEAACWCGQVVASNTGQWGGFHQALRDRLVAVIRFSPLCEPGDLARLLLVLDEDVNLLLASGGVMRAFSEHPTSGILVEDVDFNREVREGEAAWMKLCSQLDAGAAQVLREMIGSCLQAVRASGDSKTLAKVRATLSEQAAEAARADSPLDAVAATMASLLQSAGEAALKLPREPREAWEREVLAQLAALGPVWRGRIFRAPVEGETHRPSVLAHLAGCLTVAQRVSLVLDFPGGIVSERSDGLGRLLRRILADPERAPEVERALHAEASAQGMSEETYASVVGVLLSRKAMPSPVEATRLEASARSEPGPRPELAELLETLPRPAVRQGRAGMLLELLDADLESAQYDAVATALAGLAATCLTPDEDDLLLSLLENLQAEATGVRARSAGRRAMASGALTRAGRPGVVTRLVEKLGRSDEAQRNRILGFLGQLGPEGTAALATLARGRSAREAAAALPVLARSDGPAFPNLRRLLTELPVPELPTALRALVATGDVQLDTPLMAVLERREVAARLELVRTFREERAARHAPLLVPLLRDQAPEVRRAAADALGELRVSESVPALLHALGSETERGPGPRVKEAMVRALGAIGSPEAVSGLARLLRGGGLLSRFSDPGPRLAAVEALSRIATPEAREALHDWPRCRDPRVQEAARRALGLVPARTG